MRKRPLLWFACVFLTGLAYERYQRVELLFIPIYFLIQEIHAYFYLGGRELSSSSKIKPSVDNSVTGDVYLSWKNFSKRNWKRLFGRSIVLLFAFFLGMFQMHREEDFRNIYLSNLEEGNKVTVWGEVKKFETTEYGNRCILTDCYIRIYEISENSFTTKQVLESNDIMLYLSSDHNFKVGELYKITGKMKKFNNARNQGDFDSERFYQSQKIDFIVEVASSQKKVNLDVEEDGICLLGSEQNLLEEAILSLKERLKTVYENGMSEKTAGFYIAMLLGDKTNLEEMTKELFIIGGISHILAISGLHMSMIGRRVYTLLRRCSMGFWSAGLCAGSMLLAYCYMVGSGMSAIRAVGMMLFFFLAQSMGRSYDMLNTLGGMMIILLWENPFLLEYSGFWFSILALVGVGFSGKYLSMQSETDTTIKIKIKKNFWMSMGITLTTLPIVAYNYYEIPLYSTMVNMIVLPLLTPIFLLAVLGGIFGLWVPCISRILFFHVVGCLHFMSACVKWLKNFLVQS